MIISADSLTLSFLVVASVTLAVVVVLIWYVYTTKKFRDDIIKLMDEKLEMYLDNNEPPKQEEPDLDKMSEEFGKDMAKSVEEKPQEEKPQEEQKEVAESEPEEEDKDTEPQKKFIQTDNEEQKDDTEFVEKDTE